MDIFDRLALIGIVPVVKIENAADAAPLCDALRRGGLPAAEITFRTDAAAQAISNVHAALPGVLLGAGTVLTVDQARRAAEAGATYIVSPGLNPKVVSYCIERGMPVLPGCSGPSDIERALEMGLDTVKFFPAEAMGGLKFIKAVAAPYGGVRFVPTGGVNEKNVADYISYDRVRAVGGSWMVPSDAVKAKDWPRIERLTRAAVDAMLGLSVARVELPCGEADVSRFSALLGGGALALTGQTGRGRVIVRTNSLSRAVWHLEQRGFACDGNRLREQVAGFDVYLAQGEAV